MEPFYIITFYAVAGFILNKIFKPMKRKELKGASVVGVPTKSLDKNTLESMEEIELFIKYNDFKSVEDLDNFLSHVAFENYCLELKTKKLKR